MLRHNAGAATASTWTSTRRRRWWRDARGERSAPAAVSL